MSLHDRQQQGFEELRRDIHGGQSGRFHMYYIYLGLKGPAELTHQLCVYRLRGNFKNHNSSDPTRWDTLRLA